MIHGQEEKLQTRVYTEEETVKPSLFANFSAWEVQNLEAPGVMEG